MEEEVEVRVQVEVGSEEQDEGETHGKGQSEEASNEEQTLNRSSWMVWRWNDARMETLEPCGVMHIIRRVQCA